MHRLTRKELRIIEETKREGAELEKQEQSAGTARKRAGLWSILALILIFILLTVAARLVVASCT